jgi:hypothetical protein
MGEAEQEAFAASTSLRTVHDFCISPDADRVIIHFDVDCFYAQVLVDPARGRGSENGAPEGAFDASH